MRNSFLLSTAAVLVTVTAASAADLPSKKAAPVEYVKVCKVADGKMGFVVPGTDTCLQVGGFARFQYDATPTYHAKGTDVTAFGVVGSLNAVAYNQTEYGLLTGRVRIAATNTGASLDQAWLQLGGFTAGLFGSAYKFYDGAFGVGSAYSPSGAGNKPIQAQYAFNFGAGTFTVALEQPQRTTTVLNGFATPSLPASFSGNARFDYAGQRVPDVVAALDATFGVATLHLGGALHQVSSNGINATGVTYDFSNGLGLGPNFPVNNVRLLDGQGIDGKWGFAILGGAKAAFTPADTLYLEAAYTSGATNRSESWSGGFKNLRDLGTFGDFVVDTTTATPSVKLIDTWYGLAAFQHAWTPTFSTFVSASYLVIDLPKIGGTAQGKFNQTKLALGATWTPIKNFSVSPELAYINAAADNAAQTSFGITRKTESNYTARLRVQRDF